MAGTTGTNTNSQNSTNKKPKKPKSEDDPLVKSLCLVDPLLQFLTKRSGKTSVPLTLLKNVLPGGVDRHPTLLQHIFQLHQWGILRLFFKPDTDNNDVSSWDSATAEIGFPTPQPLEDYKGNEKNRQTLKQAGSLSGSTKTAAKRRLTALKKMIKTNDKQKGDDQSTKKKNQGEKGTTDNSNDRTDKEAVSGSHLKKDWDFDSYQKPDQVEGAKEEEEEEEEELCHQAKAARAGLQQMFSFQQRPKKGQNSKNTKNTTTTMKNIIPQYLLPKQAAYSGSQPAQSSNYAELTAATKAMIPPPVLAAFGLGGSQGQQQKLSRRRLYSHQANAIGSALQECHTLVCTSTGSGKSLCFLIPALTAAYNASVAHQNNNENDTASSAQGISLIMFPTKALAQDQFNKLKILLEKNEELQKHIVPATLDGDCPHAQRSHVAKHANVILTNPDTLHAAILPQWNKLYKRILLGLKYVVIDEAHVYEGMFGTHVALILSRLQRLCVVTRCNHDDQAKRKTPTFLSSSATLEYPEYHMRLLCPIPNTSKVNVLTAKDDGSPRSAKHFFVWNPPLLNMSGESTGSVFYPKPASSKKKNDPQQSTTVPKRLRDSADSPYTSNAQTPILQSFRRRHAADETALLLARAISLNVRCIAFCKTRMVVEWVYERTVAALRREESTKHLVEKVQPYRGGYKLSDRREIEKKLFDQELLGVVATSALELGVDIGGIELTLHTGYPTSISSLLQQAGRAGRGVGAQGKPSLSVVVCFGSPSEQYLWKKPLNLLSRGISAPRSFPINAGVVQGHLLCASKEFPLTGKVPVSVLRTSNPEEDTPGTSEILPDEQLFGSQEAYTEALARLCKRNSVVPFRAPVASGGQLQAYKAHAFEDKPWMRVSVRSVEPVSFSIVDIAHPAQAGNMKAIQDESAVLDNLPYSRVFYHAFPGAIILHRGQKYEVLSMTRPPPYDPSCAYARNLSLAAFARPTQKKYMTRPLSNNTITIVKQIERVDVRSPAAEEGNNKMEDSAKPGSREEQQQKESPSLEGNQKGELKVSPVSVVDAYAGIPDQNDGSFAGCGVVTSKRTVHGYKKLSLITRSEMSRHELSLPPMEYDTFGLWIDAEPETLGAFLGNDYGSGVHALSHALLAVSPLFTACVRSDLECDHSTYSPTRVCLFDERAGGSGTCAELWKSMFIPNGLLESAVELLESCPSCQQDNNDLGCPACLQSGECVKFNAFLSRSAGLCIGKRMLQRLKQSDRYKANVKASEEEPETRERPTNDDGTPRKKRRTQALRHAKDLDSARGRLFVVGRPSWPTDQDNMPGNRQENAAN
ncbi:dependent helicase HRQ1 [Seminavis robusta]|uniref:Dependent helicase HRQ1 n=1 Tax=Seminavis robusta TaxID=568900 RepID=A0A9N8DB90_9STRA|nr:dependent helicase HRQ1 [Seminavis robusta]|eukprot:Sro42_g025570.1 dependent helicase HRQ1 (1315) ;mRNA; f:58039-62092